MKTLVVLLALASLAIAAPALPGEAVTKFDLDKFPEVVKREKKSPKSDDDSGTNEAGTDIPTPHHSDLGPTGRSFGLKKPIIIKKKLGYHLYRSSDEEQAQADPQESCRQQVKVKLCDEENNTKSNSMRSSTNEDSNTHMTEKDMKHSIQLAKEAVANLQRDLKKIEHRPSMKLASWQQDVAKSDAEIHEDIEVARQALEHVNKNFGNLESMSLHATTAKNEDVHDIQFTMAKTEEERMAQWKEAIENIHKNVEIARNIEDTFKLASDDSSLIKNDETNKNTNGHDSTEKEHMQTVDDNHSKETGSCEDEPTSKTKSKSTEEKSNEKSTEKEDVDDMKASASTVVETKVHGNLREKTLLENQTTRNTEHEVAQSDMEKKNTVDDHNKHDKSAELQSSSTPNFLPENPMTMRTTEAATETNPNTEEIMSVNTIKSIESDRSEDKSLLKSAEQIEPSHDDMKENKQLETQLNPVEAKAAVDTSMPMKSAETINKETEAPSPKIENHNSLAHNTKSSENTENSNAEREALHNKLKNVESTDQMQSHSTQSSDQKPAATRNMEMKHADTNSQHHQLSDPSHMRWSQDNSMNLDQSSRMKAAEGLLKDFHDMDHSRTNQFTNHNTAMKNFQDHPMTHGKSAHMDNLMQSNFHMSMRDAVPEFSPEHHMFRWTPQHESARTAYGSGPANGVNIGGGAGGGSGAVGVFPNANIGSCGIPLLLSCSPSVVSGSLAKAHPTSYGAPSYRTEDDFNFHTKRDAKKTNEILATKGQRTPTNIQLKSSRILDTKH